MRRVVLFKKQANADWASFEAAVSGLVDLDQHMAEMDSWWVQIRDSQGAGWDAALVADFADLEALHRYEVHPRHVEVATGVGAVAEFAVFDSDS